MAAQQVTFSKETVKKARKANFSHSEIALLTEKVEESLSVIKSRFTDSVTNHKKNENYLGRHHCCYQCIGCRK